MSSASSSVPTDQARGDYDVVIVQILDCPFGIIRHPALSQELQVPLVHALYDKEDTIKACLSHFVYQPFA